MTSALKWEVARQSDPSSARARDCQAGEGPTSLADFDRLPYHLQASIITMACWLPMHAQPAEKHRPVVYLDSDTAKSLAAVSKAFHSVVVKVLYEKIHITRPSTLRLLVSTLTKQPRLGCLIKSLHIGPEDVLPVDWLPCHNASLVLSMSAPTDRGRLPSWMSAAYGRPIFVFDPESEAPPLAVRALKRAIDTARDQLDLDLAREGMDPDELTMPRNLWYLRAFLAWAAVELYVLEMARYDKRHARSTDPQASLRYPRLSLTGEPITPYFEPPESGFGPVFNLTTDQVRARLATPKLKVDRFDHPLIFARSDVAWEAEGPDGQLRRGGNSKRRREDRIEDEASVVPYTRSPPLASTATIKGILRLATTLLSCTTQVKTLSLTGFLERVVCGAYAPETLHAVRSLSIGPPSQGWAWTNALEPSKRALQGLERLRLSGHVLSKGQATAIGSGMLPKLRVFQWCYPAQVMTGTKLGKGSHLLDVINLLIGRDSAPASASPDKKKSRKRGQVIEDADEVDPLFIEVTLHPRDVTSILNTAPDVATRIAWREGAEPPVNSRCRRRFRLVDSQAGDNVEEAGCSERRAQMEEMYKKEREWFEEGLRGWNEGA